MQRGARGGTRVARLVATHVRPTFSRKTSPHSRAVPGGPLCARLRSLRESACRFCPASFPLVRGRLRRCPDASLSPCRRHHLTWATFRSWGGAERGRRSRATRAPPQGSEGQVSCSLWERVRVREEWPSRTTPSPLLSRWEREKTRRESVVSGQTSPGEPGREGCDVGCTCDRGGTGRRA